MPRIGAYTLYAIETGRFGLDGGAMFGIVPKPVWTRRLTPDARNRIPLNMRCLLLEGDGRLILIDNGLGDKYDARFQDLFAVDPDYATLTGSLAAAGFRAEDVTDVVLTHLHFDHCGGSTRRVGDGLEVAFPRARFHVQRDQWFSALDPNPRERGSFLEENLEPLAGSGQLNLLEGATTLWPGVDVLPVHGHTEAMQMVKISGPEGTLVFAADLLPTSAHLAPAWGMAYDVRPLVTIREKAAFLEQAHREGWQVFFEHDPEVAVAGLRQTERGIAITDPRPLKAL